MSPLTKAVALFLAGMAFLPLYRASAAENPSCNFQSKFDTLRSIQVDGSRDYIEAVRAQLQVRKDILKQVLDCALKDVNQRQSTLEGMSEEYRSSEAGKAIAEDLQNSAAFYDQKKQSIDDLGIKGTQDLARDIAFWRSHNYKPITERQDSFQLWANNQQLFQKTASRFAQMRPAVLSITLIDHEDIKADWKDAEDEFKDAEGKNQAAKALLMEEPSKAPQLIRSSLESLSEIYKKFMDVSDAIKKSLP